MPFLYKIRYLLQETLLGLRRGGWLNWAAISTLLVLLFLVGIGVELSWGVEAGPHCYRGETKPCKSRPIAICGPGVRLSNTWL
jgi:hypothetical protein